MYTKARTDAPLLFSAFKYNVGFWPPALVARTGNLVLYNSEFTSPPPFGPLGRSLRKLDY